MLAVSSNVYPMEKGPNAVREFEDAFRIVCKALAEDVVRNGEGVKHVIRVNVQGAPTYSIAKGVGKSVVNSPLLKTAIAGNDANVGRIIAAVGKYVGANHPELSMDKFQLAIGGELIFKNGEFCLNSETEEKMAQHLKNAQMYESKPEISGSKKHVFYSPPVDYPTHHRCVEIAMDLGVGNVSADIYGSDLTHEYVSENADYRS